MDPQGKTINSNGPLLQTFFGLKIAQRNGKMIRSAVERCNFNFVGQEFPKRASHKTLYNRSFWLGGFSESQIVVVVPKKDSP